MNKITIRDVAAHAKVSTATVSYVLNGRTDQKISEPTKKRVMEAVRELKYQPDILAAHLARQSTTRIIGIYYSSRESSAFRISRRIRIIEQLSSALMGFGYSVLLLNARTEDNLNLPACVVAIDVTQETYDRIKQKIYVPTILFDSFVDDPEPYQVYADYEETFHTLRKKMFPDVPFFLAMAETHNVRYQEFVARSFPKEDVYFYDTNEGFRKFLENHKNHYGIIIGQELANLQFDLGFNQRTFTITTLRARLEGQFNTVIYRDINTYTRIISETIEKALFKEEGPESKLIPIK